MGISGTISSATARSTSVGGAAGAQLGHRGIVTLHHHVHVLNVNLAASKTNAPGQILIDLHNDDLGLGQHVGNVGGHEPEVEVAVGVHGGDLKHGHVHWETVPVKPGQLRIAQRAEVAHAFGHNLAVNAAHMPGIPDEMLSGIFCLCDFWHPHGNTAPDLHIRKLIFPLSQSLVQGHRVVGTPAIFHPVAGLDHLDRLGGGGQLLFI